MQQKIRKGNLKKKKKNSHVLKEQQEGENGTDEILENDKDHNSGRHD